MRCSCRVTARSCCATRWRGEGGGVTGSTHPRAQREPLSNASTATGRCEDRARLRQTWQQFFTEHDVLLTPAAPTPAIAAGSRSLAVDGTERSFFDQTGWANLTSHVGLPSLVIPLTTTEEGLPLGVQIIGPAYADRVLLALAEELTPLLRAVASGASS
ncbi:amidase family protein [Streptomyces sp. WAC00263]|uniref:amidase family protein n=1 Tax=Streptomyces sp. WAC00263 TaxID=1917422 RepID=UPI0019D55F72|nr:amidase family protein [Streptomyces sp. WAC00263]